MKKIISFVLALMMVLSMMTAAFAATSYPDIDAKNKVLTDAVGLLSGLGIVGGYPDGTYKPEKVVTRAEMAKLLVTALGYGNMPGGTASFTDTKGHWGESEIAWAADLGIIDGYPDKSFKPDNPVSYTHAMVMILRALGYNNSSLNGGKSDEYVEANYKKRALELRLYDDLTTLTGGANRGDVAIMIRSALNQYKVEDGPTGKYQIVTDYDEKGNEIKRTLLSYVAQKKTVTVNDELLAKKHEVDLTEYMYQTISVYTNEVGSIIYVEGSLNTVGELEDNSKSDAIVSVSGTKYTLAYDKNKVNVFYNGAGATKNLNEIPVGAKVILSGDAGKYSIVGIVYEGINDIDVITKAYKTGDKKIGNISLPVSGSKVDLTKVVVTGDAGSLEDIEINDVIQVCRAEDGSRVKIYVTRKAVTGTVGKRSNSTQEVVINDVAYEFTEYKSNLGSTPITYVKVGVGDKGIFLLDMTGKIAYIKGESSTTVVTEETYGFVYGFIDGEKGEVDFEGVGVKTYPKVRIYGIDGKYKDYEIAVSLNADGTIKTKAENVNISKNLEVIGLNNSLISSDTTTVVVTYTLDANKRINKIDVQNLKVDTEKVTNANFLADGNTSLVVKESSKIYKLVAKSDLRTDTAISFQYIGDIKGWKLVVLPTSALKGNTVVEETKYGVITTVYEVTNKSGNPAYEVTMLVEGKEVVYNTANNFILTSGSGTFTKPEPNNIEAYNYALNGDGELTSMTYKPGSVVTVVSCNGDYIMSKGQRHTFSTSATIYKVVDDKIVLGSVRDIVEGIKVCIIKNDNEFVEVVIVL